MLGSNVLLTTMMEQQGTSGPNQTSGSYSPGSPITTTTSSVSTPRRRKTKTCKSSLELLNAISQLNRSSGAIKQSYLMKQGIKWKTWKRRYFQIIGDVLIYRDSDVVDDDSNIIGLLNLQNGTIQADEKNKRMFHVKCEKVSLLLRERINICVNLQCHLSNQSYSDNKIFSERVYSFQICSEESEEERDDWVQKLKRAATQHARSRMRARTRAPIMMDEGNRRTTTSDASVKRLAAVSKYLVHFFNLSSRY